MKVIIAGSRSITQMQHVIDAIDASGWRDHIREVVSGNARGVDRLGEIWAVQHGLPFRAFPADWDKHGKAAGMIRNRTMAEYADGLIAIWNGDSRGTRNMVTLARAQSLEVFVFMVGQLSEIEG
jgi:hypothetical protein